MKSKDGFVQAYNAQAAVDGDAQIIVAHDVTQSAGDCGQLIPMTDATKTNLGRYPAQLRRTPAIARRAISKRWRPATSTAMWRPVGPGTRLPARLMAGHCRAEPASPPSRKQCPSRKQSRKPTRVEAMRAKLKAGGHASPYRLRKQLPEPVFGQIKQARAFRQFLLRGFEKVCGEWAMVCTVHNLLKLAQGRT